MGWDLPVEVCLSLTFTRVPFLSDTFIIDFSGCCVNWLDTRCCVLCCRCRCRRLYVVRACVPGHILISFLLYFGVFKFQFQIPFSIQTHSFIRHRHRHHRRPRPPTMQQPHAYACVYRLFCAMPMSVHCETATSSSFASSNARSLARF